MSHYKMIQATFDPDNKIWKTIYEVPLFYVPGIFEAALVIMGACAIVWLLQIS